MAAGKAIKAASAEGLAPGETLRRELDGGEQTDLLQLDEGAAQAEAQLGPAAGKRRGRKPGARNIATQRVVEYLRASGTDPLIALSQVAAMSPAQIRRAFQIEKGSEAARLWLDCTRELVRVMYPPRVLEALADAAQRGEGVQVFGLALAAQLAPGQAGTAGPSIAAGRAASAADEGRRPLPDAVAPEPEENQCLRGREHD